MIRLIVGLLLTMGAVGGVEVAESNVDLLLAVSTALLGLTIMFWATSDLQKQ